jgi:hypothetical protein
LPDPAAHFPGLDLAWPTSSRASSDRARPLGHSLKQVLAHESAITWMSYEHVAGHDRVPVVRQAKMHHTPLVVGSADASTIAEALDFKHPLSLAELIKLIPYAKVGSL